MDRHDNKCEEKQEMPDGDKKCGHPAELTACDKVMEISTPDAEQLESLAAHRRNNR